MLQEQARALAAVLHITAGVGIDVYSNLLWRRWHGVLAMRRSAAVVFLIALFPPPGEAEPGVLRCLAEADLLQGGIAVAQVGSPPEDVGATLWAWDHIKSSNNVPELEAFAARYKGSFLAELARRRIEALEGQRPVRPPAPVSATN
jgi:hypothetical protein